MKSFFVYILASKRGGVLYTGVTNNLPVRIDEHKSNTEGGFTQKYHVHKLVYYEVCSGFRAAITREKRIKKWERQWKINLIEKDNPEWNDLSEDLY